MRRQDITPPGLPRPRSRATLLTWISGWLIAMTAAPTGAQASPADRGWTLLHGVIHAHTPYSHDACDDDGLLPDGSPNPECLAELRAGACASRHHFIFFTDHPSYMRDYPMEALVLYDPDQGDRLLYSAQGILANEITCSDGTSTWKVWITNGAEGDHNMPIGLEAHLADPAFYSVGFEDSDDLAQGQEAVAQVHDAGGVALLAHAEADEVSADRMVALGIDGVELYNAHANFEWMLVHHPLQILHLETWMGTGPGSPRDYDLVALMMIPYASDAPVTKWNDALATAHMAGVIGTDVHQNVTLDPYCEPSSPLAALCQRLKPLLPNMVSYLETGGPLMLGDGERLDSYRRMFRWFSNHLLAAAPGVAEAKEAVAAGRLYAAFDILGLPAGFDLVAQNDVTGEVYEMGDDAPFSPDLKLRVTLPVVSMDDPYATWTSDQAAQAAVRAEVLWIDERGARVIASGGEAGGTLVVQVPGPGAFRVEIFIQPRHLEPVLGKARLLGRQEYRWIWSNPVYVSR